MILKPRYHSKEIEHLEVKEFVSRELSTEASEEGLSLAREKRPSSIRRQEKALKKDDKRIGVTEVGRPVPKSE